MSGTDQPQRQVLRLHGRTHLPGGPDPIVPHGIFYDYDNVGDWLYIKTTDDVSGDLSAMFLGVVFDGDGVGITNADGSGGQAALLVLGGDADSNVRVLFGGSGSGAPFFLDGGDSLSSSLSDLFDFAQADGAGNNSELTLSGGEVSLGGTGGIDIVSNAGGSTAPFPVAFGANSVQIAAGDDTNYGTVILEAFDRQATPAYTEFFVGYVDFNPNPYSYNGQVAQILGGQKFTIVGSDGSPIFQVDSLEAGGAVHIKTGGTVVANL